MTASNFQVTIKGINGVGSDHKANFEKFDSANELLKVCLERKFAPNGGFSENTLGGSRDGDSWMGVKSAKEAMDMLANGWAQNVDKLKQKMNGIQQKVDGKRITFHNDVVGYNPIVPLAIMGVPESMQNSYMKPMKSKILDIYYDTTVSCGNTPEQILANGMKLMETVINLENSGYRIRLTAMQSYAESTNSDILLVGVKSEFQPLDIKRIMFPLMHPGMFRCIGFGWYERCPTARHRSGYGHALSYQYSEEKMNEFVRQAFGKTATYLSGKFIQDKSQEHIENQLKGENTNDKKQA